MGNEAKERQLARTVRQRTREHPDPEVEAMREVERSRVEPMARLDVETPEVKRLVDPGAAIPSRAPLVVKRQMSDRMRSWVEEVNREIPGETLPDRNERLDRARAELYPETDERCPCGGTGFIRAHGERRLPNGNIFRTDGVKPCDCPHGQARRDAEKQAPERETDSLDDRF